MVEDAFGLPIARLLAPAGTDDQESDKGEGELLFGGHTQRQHNGDGHVRLP